MLYGEFDGTVSWKYYQAYIVTALLITINISIRLEILSYDANIDHSSRQYKLRIVYFIRGAHTVYVAYSLTYEQLNGPTCAIPY